MRFDLSDDQAAWQSRGHALADALSVNDSPVDIVARAVTAGLLAPAADLLSLAVATEAIATTSPASAVAYAMHITAAHALAAAPDRAAVLWEGRTAGALALSSDDVPVATDGTLTGDVSWVAPVTPNGIAIVGARRGDHMEAFALAFDSAGVAAASVVTAGLAGLACAHLTLTRARADRTGTTAPVMARARVLMAAVGLGIGRRALDEALVAVRASGGAQPDEQTVQGLLADTATELDAATLLTWKAAAQDDLVSLGQASVAKLASTEAAQHAVLRATQVVGAETFRRHHTIERLAQDVRALELFAGRTEALRAAVAAEIL